MAPHPEFVKVNEATQKSAEKEATKVLKSLNKMKERRYASLPSPALSQAERDWGSGDWFGTTDESNPDIDADPSAYADTGVNVTFRQLRHRLWAKVWATMDHGDMPEEAAYNIWATQNNILPAWSAWIGPDGQSCLPQTVAPEKKKAMAPEECVEQETPLGENHGTHLILTKNAEEHLPTGTMKLTSVVWDRSKDTNSTCPSPTIKVTGRTRPF
jgi:hypothetical protein